MTKKRSIIFMILLFFLATCTTAHAIKHEIGGSLGVRFDDFEVDNSDAGGERNFINLNAGYKFYFSDLKNRRLPIDLLPFLLHPSYVYGRLYRGQYDYERDDSDYETDKDWLGIKAGGMFYLPSNTGLGGFLRYHQGDWENNRGNSHDEDEKELAFQVDQYLGDSSRLHFSLSREMEDKDYSNSVDLDTTEDWFRFSYRGAYGTATRFVLDVKTGIGQKEEDYGSGASDWQLYNFGIALGPAMRHFSIYFAIDYTKENADEDFDLDFEELEFSIQPRIWFNEHFLLGFDLAYFIEKAERDDFEREFKGPGLEISLAGRF